MTSAFAIAAACGCGDPLDGVADRYVAIAGSEPRDFHAAERLRSELLDQRDPSPRKRFLESQLRALAIPLEAEPWRVMSFDEESEARYGIVMPKPHELEGQRIRKGQTLMLYYPSANRDESVFESPDVFDIDRRNNHHLAFGVGEHFCLGTHLARLETRVMFEGILERMHDLELAGPVAYLRSNLIDGVKHIPLKFTGAPA